MPVAVSYPGVYIEEVPSTVRTITGVATSITAFVGYTARGLDHRATRVQSFGDYERRFGGLMHNSELSYAVQQFFENGGSQAYVVRVPKVGSEAARIALGDAESNKVLTVTALSKGVWGNDVIVDIDHAVPAGDPLAFNFVVTDRPTGVVETFSVTMDAGKSNYVLSINDVDNGSQLVSVSVQPATDGNPIRRPAETGTVGGTVVLADILPEKRYTLKVSSSLPDATISALEVVFLESGEAIPTSLLGVCRLLENKLNVALQKALPGARVSCVASATLGIRVRASFPPETIPSALDAILSFEAGDPSADAAAVLKLMEPAATLNVAHYWLGQGADAGAQSEARLGSDGTALPGSADLIGSESLFTGLYALEHVDIFNLLAIPDASRASPSDPTKLDAGVNPNAVFEAALAYCQKRRAFLLVDAPPDINNVDKAVDWATEGLSARGSNGAAYFPRLKLRDPLDDYQMRVFAPCGVVAGLYARTDATRGVWKAPAGTEAQLAGVQGAVCPLTDAQNGLLNPLGLNCFRTFPVYRTVSWGARTLDGADARASPWKYVPVRRLALFMEESLYRGTQWVVFEPNDPSLWSQIRMNLGAFMHDLFRQGAFQGTTPAQAYFVKCDQETTTQSDIDLGIVNIVVGFAPLKPAEFVVIKIQQIAGESAA